MKIFEKHGTQDFNFAFGHKANIFFKSNGKKPKIPLRLKVFLDDI